MSPLGLGTDLAILGARPGRPDRHCLAEGHPRARADDRHLGRERHAASGTSADGALDP